MGLFKRKKKLVEQKEYKYDNWETDFGFLNLVLTRKKNIQDQFYTSMYSEQKGVNDLLTDEEVEPIIASILRDTLALLGNNYKNFLIEKYFGSEDALISYISEDIYVSLISSAISKNTKKIVNNVKTKVIKTVSNLNKKN